MLLSIHLAIISLCSLIVIVSAVPSAFAPHPTVFTPNIKRKLFNAWMLHHQPLRTHPSLYSKPSQYLTHGRVPSHSRLQTKHSFHTSTSSLPSTNLHPILLSTERQGLFFDRCCEQSDCAGDRVCKGLNNTSDFAPCSFSTVNCVCMGGLKRCSADPDCPEGEICTFLHAPDDVPLDLICVSATAVPFQNTFTPIDESATLLTGESCFTSAQCIGQRICTNETNLERPAQFICNEPGPICICRMAERLIGCDFDADCDTDGEVCAFNRDNKRFCISKAHVADGNVEFLHQSVTGEGCFHDEDCLDTRTCNAQDGGSCLNNCICFALVPQSCTSNSDCTTPHEICARVIATGTQTCISLFAAKGNPSFSAPQALPTNESNSSSSSPPSTIAPPQTTPTISTSPTQANPPPATESNDDVDPPAIAASPQSTVDAVCVDARSLSHLSPEELVFAKHVRARVLCDAHGSCATAGHMVDFRGSAMRMSSYCGMVGCAARVIFVNSPRYKRGLRINTRTEGLKFSVFSARYDTRAEEVVLGSVMRLGL